MLVGTCSWTDKTLTEETDWYPRRSMTAEERLKFYASRFPIVEVDSTYYFPPSPQLARTWVERTPKQFMMNVKAYSLLTGHPTQPKSLWRDLRDELPDDVAAKRNLYAHHLEPDALDEVWARFIDTLKPLVKAKKLGAVLMQYPCGSSPSVTIATSWRACVRAWVTSRCASSCAHRPGSRTRSRPHPRPPARPPALFGDRRRAEGVEAADGARGHRRRLAVVRFHGRADDTWDVRTGSAAERFNYRYSKQQLRPWAKKLESLTDQAREVHALMNNCYQDHGVNNAAELRAMLAD